MYLRGLKDNITAAVLLQKPRATDMQTLYERAIDAETDMSINKSLNIQQVGTAPFRNFNRTYQNQNWQGNAQGRFNQSKF